MSTVVDDGNSNKDNILLLSFANSCCDGMKYLSVYDLWILIAYDNVLSCLSGKCIMHLVFALYSVVFNVIFSIKCLHENFFCNIVVNVFNAVFIVL